jgi:hypothetical protein
MGYKRKAVTFLPERTVTQETAPTDLVKRLTKPVKREAEKIQLLEKPTLPVLNERTFAVIKQMLEQGNFIDTAAAAVGFSPALIRRYLEKGFQEVETKQALYEAEEINEEEIQLSIYAQLFLEVTRISAEAQSKLVKKIDSAGALQWQAAAWLLERRHSKQWGKQNIANTKEVKHTIKTLATPVQRVDSDEDFLQLVKAENATTVTETEITETRTSISEGCGTDFDEL